MPDMGAAFGVAVGAFLFHPHCGRQDEIGRERGHRWVSVGHHDEVLSVTIAKPGFLVGIRSRLQVVVDLHPIGVEQAVLEHPVLQYRMVAGFVGNGAFGKFPDLLGDIAMRLVGHHHVGRQAVREGADFARGAAGRRLTGEREWAVAGLGDFAG